MTNKKKYQAPAFEVIKMKSLPCLNPSSPGGDPFNPGEDPEPDPANPG